MVSFPVKNDKRRVRHSIKVGVALVLVSLLYLLDPLYEQVGDNAMWAIMTVVVVFEFYAGATLSKGLNRGIGTILGGGLGCLAAVFAEEVGGVGHAIIIGTSVFIFGTAATYARLIPSIKKRYDYGAMIFILTFNLVAVSGIRADKVVQLARERLSTIVIGFAICIFVSLLVFPIWSSDELHDSVASRFSDLAASIQGFTEEYFAFTGDKESRPEFSFSSCKSVLHSKSKDELLANFARWEPWHGKFGLFHPWDKYLTIAELLRDIATTIISLKPSLQSSRESSDQSRRELIKEPCEGVGRSLAWILRELGESLKKTRRCHSEILLLPKLETMREELSQMMSSSRLGQFENADGFAVASFLFSFMEIIDKVEELAKEVEQLGKLAHFAIK